MCFTFYLFFTNIIKSLYNTCLYHLLNIHLNEQSRILKEYKLLPFKYRIFFRFAMFSYKIMNRHILHNFCDDLVQIENCKNLRNDTRRLFETPTWKLVVGAKRLSVCLPELINKVLRLSYVNTNLNEFKNCKSFLSFCKLSKKYDKNSFINMIIYILIHFLFTYLGNYIYFFKFKQTITI